MKACIKNQCALEFLRDLPDGFADACITSPPYNMNIRINAKGDGYCSRQIVKEASTKYKTYPDNLAMDEYEEMLVSAITESVRVAEISFFNIQQITGNKPSLYRALGRVAHLLKETIIWDKTRAQPAINDKTLNSEFEFIFVFGSNPIARRFDSATFERGSESNVWRFNPHSASEKDNLACFPRWIPEKIIKTFVPNPSVIIDPFVGSGTTGVAAANHGCSSFYGSDIAKDQTVFAEQRIKESCLQSRLF